MNCILNTRFFLCAITLFSLSFITGCSEDGIPTYEVSGTVTMDGAPLPQGGITFLPADGKGPSDGGTIKDGKYTASITLGAKTVKIVGTKVVGQVRAYEDDPNSPMNDITEDIPFINADDLTATVSDSTLEFNFDLKTK